MKVRNKMLIGLATLVLVVVTMGTGIAQQSDEDSFRSVPSSMVLLSATGTMVLQTNPNAPHAASGWQEYTQCEGDPDGDYVCSNSFATYGCNEACKCCYYEETYNVDPDRPGSLTAPFRFIQNSQISKFYGKK